jgi:hypothetical protein
MWSESLRLARLPDHSLVTVDFIGIDAVNLQFLNAALGTLIRELPWNDLKESISIKSFPLRYSYLLEAVFMTWRSCAYRPNLAVKKKSLMLDMAYLFTAFEERFEEKKRCANISEPMPDPSESDKESAWADSQK